MVEIKLLDLPVVQINERADHPMPTFDGAEGFIGLKNVKCTDQYRLDWCSKAV